MKETCQNDVGSHDTHPNVHNSIGRSFLRSFCVSVKSYSPAETL